MKRVGRIAAFLLAACAVIAALCWMLIAPPPAAPTMVEEQAPAQEADSATEVAAAPQEAEAGLAAAAETTRVSEPTIPKPVQDGHKRIEVIALDSDGNTVEGVPVAVGMVIPFERRAIRLASGFTDAEGRAQLEIDPQRWRRDAPLLANPELMIDAKIPHPERVRVKRQYEQTLASPTTLTVPALSWIEVSAVHADGSPIDVPMGFSFNWAPAAEAGEADAWSKYQSLESDGNRARFLVGPKLALRLSAWDQAHRYVTGYLDVAGPEQTLTEPQRHVIELGPLHPSFRARLILPDGQPARDMEFRQYQRLTRLATEEYPAGKAETRWNSNQDTDAEGWIDLPLPTNDYLQRFDREWIWVLYPKDRSQPRPELDAEGTIQAVTPIPRGLADGQVLDFGEVQLQTVRFPLIATGQLHDENGQPISIEVWVYAVNDQGRTDRETIWRGKSDREGYFEVRAEAPLSGMVELSVGGRGWTGKQVRTNVGSEGLDITLVPAIDLYGSVILDDGLPWMEIEVRMPPGRAKRLGLGGGFKVDYVRPASDAYVWFEHNDIELWRSAPFVIEGRGEIRPDAVQKQDLRGTMRAWVTTMVDEQGEVIAEDTDIEFLTSDRQRSSSEVQRLGYWAQITKSDVSTLQIAARGYESQLLSWPLPDKVVLRKSLR